MVCVGALLASSCLQTWWATQELATNFLSVPTWTAVVGPQHKVSFSAVLLRVAMISVVTWIGGAIWLARSSSQNLIASLGRWGLYGWIWWCLLGLWEWIWVAAGLVGWSSLASVLSLSPQIWLSLCVSGWITTLFCLIAASRNPPPESPLTGATRSSAWLWLACTLYIVVFTTMNWRLYFNLLVPHGDSVMYEEHLWNLLHGKGFRSYLDQGLFLGEHIQFVHLFLIPLYVLWPSHLLLELCESTALALGAFPVFWMARRHSQSERIALAAAIAYLLYTPMQFLDIEIDLKTFRPEAFGIPLLLLTLDQLERQRLVGFLVGLVFTLTVKEDYAIISGPLGIWVALWGGLERAKEIPDAGARLAGRDVSVPERSAVQRRTWRRTGLGLSVFSVVYLWLATRVVMPWFRSGAEVHYARYFSKFGTTPEQILGTMISQPGLLFGELFSIATALYALALLAPVVFLPLCSPGRLAVGMPLFGILCLNELAKDPRHQFHAPLVAIVFWAVAGGLPRAARVARQIGARLGLNSEMLLSTIPVLLRTLLWSGALTVGVFFSLCPLGITFWDPGSGWYWGRLYGSSRRAEMFARVLPLLPPSSRVASTDFVHPRFTHFERSYDYSGYRRKVSDFELRVPDDTDFIVIDTQHRYSTIKRPAEVSEYRDHPEQWELLPDETDGYFIVLRRRR